MADTDAKLLAANALESAWRAYERNEADLTRLGHEFRLHAEIVLQALRSTQYVPPPQDAMQAALWRDVALLNPMDVMMALSGAETDNELLLKIEELVERRRSDISGGGS